MTADERNMLRVTIHAMLTVFCEASNRPCYNWIVRYLDGDK